MIQGRNMTLGIHSLPMDTRERIDGGSAWEHGSSECSDSPEDDLSKKNQTAKVKKTQPENDSPMPSISSPGRRSSAVYGTLEAKGALFERGALEEHGAA